MPHTIKLSFNENIITFHIKILLPYDRNHRSALLNTRNVYVSIEVIAKEK